MTDVTSYCVSWNYYFTIDSNVGATSLSRLVGYYERSPIGSYAYICGAIVINPGTVERGREVGPTSIVGEVRLMTN